jgi:hypothetical protein
MSLATHKHPAIRLHGFGHPQPAPVVKVGFERAKAGFPASRLGGKQPVLEIGCGYDRAASGAEVSPHQV